MDLSNLSLGVIIVMVKANFSTLALDSVRAAIIYFLEPLLSTKKLHAEEESL